ncbi:type II secretion system F family protein [Alkalibacillus aidingensis]|uniref:type II secretion system F family protein n=1 Tax=Alkalibacillus aidingensis TaxID=2747607 RepID=UPI002948B985|nr:type II secretion system F family protein [Alkalibacillus aidingensis]
MASFKYVAADYNGNIKKGKVKAYNKDIAKIRLRESGLKIERIEEIKESIWSKDIHIGSPVKHREFVIFLQQFGALLKAGLTIVESLNILREQTSSKMLKETLYYVEIDMRQGSSLTNALKKHPHIFSSMFVNMIHSGETSGTLEETTNKLAEYYSKQQQTRQKVKSTFAYPVTVAIVAIGVVIFLMLYVVPQFVDMFTQFDAELPVITQFVLSISHLLQNYWLLMILVTIAIMLVVISLYQKEEIRRKLDYYLLKTPGFGKLALQSNIASMTRTLSSLLYNHVPIIEALNLTEQTIRNRELRETLKKARTSLKQGSTLSEPFKEHWAYPYLVTQMIEVGEKTNSLDEMLDQVASFYENDVDTATEQLKSLLEPLLIISLSLIVGTIVLAIVIPMFEIFNQI